MDLARGFERYGVIRLNCRMSSSRIRGGGQHLSFVRDSRVSYRSCSLNRRKKGEFGNFHLLSKYSRTIYRAPGPILCQPNDSLDSLGFVDGSAQNVEVSESALGSDGELEDLRELLQKAGELEDLRELLQKAMKELEVARLNSSMFEEKAQRISEAAIARKDEAEHAWSDVTSAVSSIQQFIGEEDIAKEAVQKATMALSMAEARLQLAIEASESGQSDVDEELLSAQEGIKECKASLDNFETELRRIQDKKSELQKEVDRLSETAERAQLDALKAEEDVANIMLLAEQAVAFELEAAQRVNDAELALQKAEKELVSVDAANQQVPSSQELLTDKEIHVSEEANIGARDEVTVGNDGELLSVDDVVSETVEEFKLAEDTISYIKHYIHHCLSEGTTANSQCRANVVKSLMPMQPITILLWQGYVSK